MQHWCAGVAVFATQDADLTGVVIGISNSAAYGRGDPSVGVLRFSQRYVLKNGLLECDSE